jgi:hypothetical protein
MFRPLFVGSRDYFAERRNSFMPVVRSVRSI